jgi:hypothetical protein
MPPALSALVFFVFWVFFFFKVGSEVFAWAGFDHNPPIYASFVAGMTDICYHTQLFFVEMGVS